MSKHTWLCKPTASKAMKLEYAIKIAEEQGCTMEDAELAAGYWVERTVQDSGVDFEGLLASLNRSGWKIKDGKNVANYRRTVANHAQWLMRPLIDLVWNKIREDDLEFVDRLSNRAAFQPHLDIETYHEFVEAVLKTMKGI